MRDSITRKSRNKHSRFGLWSIAILSRVESRISQSSHGQAEQGRQELCCYNGYQCPGDVGPNLWRRKSKKDTTWGADYGNGANKAFPVNPCKILVLDNKRLGMVCSGFCKGHTHGVHTITFTYDKSSFEKSKVLSSVVSTTTLDAVMLLRMACCGRHHRFHGPSRPGAVGLRMLAKCSLQCGTEYRHGRAAE